MCKGRGVSSRFARPHLLNNCPLGFPGPSPQKGGAGLNLVLRKLPSAFPPGHFSQTGLTLQRLLRLAMLTGSL